jgi:hypothetical protein
LKEITSDSFTFLAEIGDKTTKCGESGSESLTHLETRQAELSRMVLLCLTQRCGNSDSEPLSDLLEVTQVARVRTDD